MSERQLLEAASAGDKDAFARLVEPHCRPLHAHCYRMLGSVPDAEDALQEALLSAWRGMEGFKGRKLAPLLALRQERAAR
jgi:RNA polymerase sigma-70 factor (ECF subfamily)